MPIDTRIRHLYNIYMKTTMNEKGAIRVLVPGLLEERGLTGIDLMYGARLAPATAYRLADGKAQRMSFDVLISLCNFFEVGVDGILEFVAQAE